MSGENLEMVELAKQWMKDANGALSVPVVAYALAEGLAKRLDELAQRPEEFEREPCAWIVHTDPPMVTTYPPTEGGNPRTPLYRRITMNHGEAPHGGRSPTRSDSQESPPGGHADASPPPQHGGES